MLVLINSPSFGYHSAMARKIQFIQLSDIERRSLKTLFRSGKGSNRQHTRARILELLDRKVPPAKIAKILSCGLATIYKIKRRYETDGLKAALTDKPRSGRPVEINGAQRARITALACSVAPTGHARWTLRMLANKAVELGFVETISHNAVKEILKKTLSSHI